MPEISEITQLKRQLKIEAALDRVRSIAMAMRRPEDLLKICKSLYRELKRLGISELRNAMINVYDDANGSFLNYDSSGEGGPSVTQFKNDSHPVIKNFLKQVRRTRDAFAPFSLQAKALQDFIRFRAINGEKTDVKLRKAKALHYYFYSAGNGSMGISTLEALDPEHIKILKRFRNVFDLAYKRYTDIAIAKAQAHEVKIELALEKVRARTMAMKKSEELAEIVSVLFKQLLGLGLTLDQLRTCGIATFHPSEPKGDIWITDIKGEKISNSFSAPFNEAPAYKTIYIKWKKGEDFFELNLKGKDFLEHLKFVKKYSSVPDINLQEIRKKYKEIFFHVLYFSQGYLFIITYEELTEHHELFKRFGAIFQQTYTRFLDLQKAEAQAREAQVELALERVRARTMAMQRSEELPEAANTLFLQVQSFGIPAWSCGYNILSADKKSSTCIMSSEGELQTPFTLPLTEHKSLKPWHNAILKGDEFFVYQQGGKELEEHYRYMKSLPELQSVFKQFEDAGLSLPTFQVNHLAKFKEGFLLFITYQSVPEAHEIFKRFTKVFEQTYTRFLDLQKAEAQARNAQIEAALERVRSRSLAMHHSHEIKEVVLMVMEKMNELEIEMDGGVSLATFRDGSRDLTHWYVNPEHVDGAIEMHLPYFKNKLFTDFEKARKKGMELLPVVYSFEDKNEYFNYAFKHSEFKIIPKALKQWILEQPCFGYSVAIQKHSAIFFNDYSGKFFSEQENQVLIRFAKVFDQAYIRFLDLQKAEAQAREAQVEAALERTRTQSMLMQYSDQLDETLRVFHEQVLLLGIYSEFSYLWLPDEEIDQHIFWAAWKENNSFKSKAVNYPLDRNEPATAQCLVDWKAKKPFVSYKVSPADVGNYFTGWSELFKGVAHLKPKEFSNGLFYTEAYIKYGCFGVMVENALTEEEEKILHKIAVEFERTYTRFLDLQKAEAQSREAQIEAALERVRSKSMAMHKSDELLDVITVVSEQLTNLDFKFHHVSFANNDLDQDYKFWVSARGLPNPMRFNVPYLDISIMKQLREAQHNGDNFYTDILSKDENRRWHKHLLNHGGDKVFPEDVNEFAMSRGMARSIAINSNIMLILANYASVPYTEDENKIIARFGKVFEQSYTRFLDLQKAELQALKAEQDLIEIKAARKRAEEALVELKFTQKQLIQSEKMASLGELTAGIAHEIQNPLNFVNNFSEVSTELVDEMKSEIDAGNNEEAKEIAADLKENLQKINHHGKRAGDIVKGMLQHSRSSSGQKELTDINALCDEYLRLAYHGLRAKDKSFNASMKTDFDNSLEKVNVIPQDIGRVILNLITNAFYAVNDKKKSTSEGYEPVVTVSTKEVGNGIEVTVKDNGNGIPDSIKDKVFQPFFTTKPTGQGTGLGLSLSYDIVKAHGGELKVESKEGEGSEFAIELPIV